MTGLPPVVTTISSALSDIPRCPPISAASASRSCGIPGPGQ